MMNNFTVKLEPEFSDLIILKRIFNSNNVESNELLTGMKTSVTYKGSSIHFFEGDDEIIVVSFDHDLFSINVVNDDLKRLRMGDTLGIQHIFLQRSHEKIYIMVCGWSHFYIVDFERFEILKKCKIGIDDYIYAGVSLNERMFCIGVWKELTIWNFDSDTPTHRLKDHYDYFCSIHKLHTHKEIIISGGDKDVSGNLLHFHDWKNGVLLRSVKVSEIFDKVDVEESVEQIGSFVQKNGHVEREILVLNFSDTSIGTYEIVLEKNNFIKLISLHRTSFVSQNEANDVSFFKFVICNSFIFLLCSLVDRPNTNCNQVVMYMIDGNKKIPNQAEDINKIGFHVVSSHKKGGDSSNLQGEREGGEATRPWSISLGQGGKRFFVITKNGLIMEWKIGERVLRDQIELEDEKERLAYVFDENSKYLNFSIRIDCILEIDVFKLLLVSDFSE